MAEYIRYKGERYKRADVRKTDIRFELNENQLIYPIQEVIKQYIKKVCGKNAGGNIIINKQKMREVGDHLFFRYRISYTNKDGQDIQNIIWDTGNKLMFQKSLRTKIKGVWRKVDVMDVKLFFKREELIIQLALR